MLELNKPKMDLLTFALYARDFNPKQPAHGKGNMITGTLMLALVAVLSIHLTC